MNFNLNIEESIFNGSECPERVVTFGPKLKMAMLTSFLKNGVDVIYYNEDGSERAEHITIEYQSYLDELMYLVKNTVKEANRYNIKLNIK